jgi:hypothetical protein
MKDIPQCPQFILDREQITRRQWRTKKRAELKAAIKAMNVLRFGCAFTPTANGVGVGELCDYLDDLNKAWSQKEWGK